MEAVEVVVPASITNLGPGFDILGLAVGLHNRFILNWSEEPGLTAVGAGAAEIGGPRDNLIAAAAGRLLEAAGQAGRSLAIHVDLSIPVSRGLGSSSTALVAGLVGANRLLGSPLPPERIWELAVEMEGHPDNVTPALFGGLQLVFAGDEGLHRFAAPFPEDLQIVVCIPELRISTAAAREVLPQTYSRTDAVFNAFGCSLLMTALFEKKYDRLRLAMRDRIHQPYRAPLLPGFDAALNAALEAGAAGAALSGSGSTLVALVPPGAAGVGDAMTAALAAEGCVSTHRTLQVDRTGARAAPVSL